MRVVSALALAGLILLGATDRSSARVQAQMYCWELDSEFPVPCEQEDEEDEGAGRTKGSDPSPLRSRLASRSDARGLTPDP
jgi:hypothetical protein